MTDHLPDRTIAPPLHPVEVPHLPEIEQLKLDNGMPLFLLRGGSQNVVKIDLIFKAGKWFESQPGLSSFTAKMLTEGTENFTSQQLAEQFDFLGAGIRIKSNAYFINVQVSTLKKYFGTVVSLLKEVIAYPIFPEHELEVLKQIRLQNLKVNEEKVEFLANKAFNKMLFGQKHPFGYSATSSIINSIKQADIKDFYKKYIVPAQVICFVAGKLPVDTVDILNHNLGKIPSTSSPISITDIHHPAIRPVGGESYTTKPNANQSAIRLGKLMPDRNHPDYPGLLVMNTIFGGYFGSRLMRNIREEKGYTYGIYSSIVPYADYSLFKISAEVGAEVCQKALDEITYEARRMIDEPVAEDELQLVKNYILGNQLNALDGAFKQMNAISSLIVWELGFDYFYNKLNVIKHITANEIQELAVTYLAPDELSKSIAGPKSK